MHTQIHYSKIHTRVTYIHKTFMYVKHNIQLKVVSYAKQAWEWEEKQASLGWRAPGRVCSQSFSVSFPGITFWVFCLFDFWVLVFLQEDGR